MSAKQNKKLFIISIKGSENAITEANDLIEGIVESLKFEFPKVSINIIIKDGSK